MWHDQKCQNGRSDPASCSWVLSAATGAGRSRSLDRGALGAPGVMSDPPGVTAGRFAICRTCQLRGRRWFCQGSRQTDRNEQYFTKSGLVSGLRSSMRNAARASKFQNLAPWCQS
jgi:hypothetical protein